MNPARETIRLSGLDAHSQGSNAEKSFAFVLLSVMAAADDANHVSTVETNPVRETLRQLAPYTSTFAVQRLSKLLNAYQDAFDRGQLR
jgi:hypothetical protein